VVPIEECCAVFARCTPLLGSREDITWLDGTVAGAYGFVHAFYQEVVYNRVTGARRVDLHRRIGEREEMGYGVQASGRQYWRCTLSGDGMIVGRLHTFGKLRTTLFGGMPMPMLLLTSRKRWRCS